MTYKEWEEKHPQLKKRTFDEFKEEVEELIADKETENLCFCAAFLGGKGMVYQCEFDIDSEHYLITYSACYFTATIWVNDNRVYAGLLTRAYNYFNQPKEEKKKFTAHLVGHGKTANKTTYTTIQVDSEEEAKDYCAKSRDSWEGEYDFYLDRLEKNE